MDKDSYVCPPGRCVRHLCVLCAHVCLGSCGCARGLWVCIGCMWASALMCTWSLYTSVVCRGLCVTSLCKSETCAIYTGDVPECPRVCVQV